MQTINTIDDAIKILREPIPYMEPDEDLMQIAEWLEELKDLRVELEKNSKELEVYKKALKMACHQITYLDCDSDCDLFEDCKHPCTTLDCGEEDIWVEFYLKKARHRNDS